MSLEAARAAFRDAARAIDPDTFTGQTTPEILRAWLCVQTVRTPPKWIGAASAACQALDLTRIPDAEVAPWVEAFCLGWVQQASGPFRNAARALMPRLANHWRSVPALLGWWRITGEPAPLKRALEALALASDAVDPELAVALRLGFLATADPVLLDRALRALGDAPSTLPPRAWPAAVDLLDLGPDDFGDALAALPSPPPPEMLPAAGALAAPPLHLDVHWWLVDELREGPMAEAATFPWPALRIRFKRLPERDQIHFFASLGDAPREELEDVGVAAPWLESLVARADKSPLLDGMPARVRRRGGLRR
ncbi:MAG: hypothetical protein KDA24_30005 [Deltaproteobacteria bacterium]|nr:hypothetical protein [Deltaproteobacteria bacterium]